MTSDILSELKVNSVIQYHNEREIVVVLRVLAIFPQDQMMGVINLYEKNSWPMLLDVSNDRIRDSIKPIAKDPFSGLLLIDDLKITPGRLQNRDNAWEIVRPIIFSADLSVRLEWFTHIDRIKLIAAHATTFNQFNHDTENKKMKTKNNNKSVKARTIGKYAQQVFTRGLHKNALLNNYHNIGKLKVGEEGELQKRNYKVRPGRKPADLHLHEDSSYGIIIDKIIEGYFKTAIDRGLKRHESLEDIFNDVLDQHFSAGDDKKGNFIHLPEELCPTFRQLEYYYSKLCKKDPTKYAILRHGQRHFNLNLRPLTGKSMFLVDGPGAVYQADSTGLEFALRSALNREWIIASQFLYTIIDCSTEIIAGWSLDYKQSWRGAQAALLCAFTDKDEILKKYQLSDLINAFPKAGICKRLVTDNGSEWTSQNSDNLTDLHIDLAQAEAYRPDLKGGVESVIGEVKHVLRNRPGSLVYVREKGTKDPRLTATLNRHEFMRMIICEIAHHNQHKWIENYPLRREMIAKEILPIPIKLWHYGVSSISGALRTYPAQYLSKLLLPRTSAAIDGKGILFQGRHYDSPTVINSQMRTSARLNGWLSTTISYNPDDTSIIYYHLPNGELEEATLSRADQAFKKLSWDDIDAFSLHYNHLQKHHKSKARQNKSNIKTRLDPEQRAAIKEVKKINQSGGSKLSKSRISENTQREKEFEKSQQHTSSDKSNAMAPVVKPIMGYIPLPDYQDEIDNANNSSEKDFSNEN